MRILVARLLLSSSSSSKEAKQRLFPPGADKRQDTMRAPDAARQRKSRRPPACRPPRQRSPCLRPATHAACSRAMKGRGEECRVKSGKQKRRAGRRSRRPVLPDECRRQAAQLRCHLLAGTVTPSPSSAVHVQRQQYLRLMRAALFYSRYPSQNARHAASACCRHAARLIRVRL